MAALRGPDAIQHMRVISVGSPWFLEQVKNVHSFGFKNDAVALMSFSVGENAAYAGLEAVENPDGTKSRRVYRTRCSCGSN